jgi:hypothetical protein
MIGARPTISRETLTRIVEAAAIAPSAENLQPWRFRIEESSILVLLDLTRQLPSDVERMLGLTGIGAAIENAVIAASCEGLRTDIENVADSRPKVAARSALPIARLRFEDSDEQPDALKKYIAARCTTRRMESTPIEHDKLEAIVDSIRGFEGVELHWVDERRLPEFARLAGMGNRIRFEHRPFHAELYHSLRFDAAEIARTRDGLDMATLQLPMGVARIMHLLRTWPRMRIANLFGFSRGVERQATAEVLKSGAVGFITVPISDAPAFIEGGRAFERMWLTATQLGLCFHPTASLPVFVAHAREGCSQLLPKHAEATCQMSVRFSGLYPDLGNRVVQMAFRIGYGPRARVRSLRRPVEAAIED